MPSFSIKTCVTIDDTAVDQNLAVLLGILLDLGLWQCELDSSCLAWSNRRQILLGSSDDLAIYHSLSHELKLVEVGEEMLVDDGQFGSISLGVDVVECHCSVGIDCLDLNELRSLSAFRSDDAVAAEVALCRTRVVIASVNTANAMLHFQWVIDSLIDPVPNTGTDAGIAALNHIPVFLQVALCITHGMRIFAEEHRLVET